VKPLYEHSRLIMYHDNKSQTMYFCHGPECEGNKDDAAYSSRHSTTLGWRSTDHPNYSPKGDKVVLCPDCIKQIKEEDEQRSRT
jgi:hypothetical protein